MMLVKMSTIIHFLKCLGTGHLETFLRQVEFLVCHYIAHLHHLEFCVNFLEVQSEESNSSLLFALAIDEKLLFSQ